jgi:hypothetical protein
MKQCSQCRRPAEISLCTVISTLGVTERRQKCTASLPFCVLCLQRVCAENEACLPLPIRQALKTALCALTEQRLIEIAPKTCLDQKGHGLEAEELS